MPGSSDILFRVDAARIRGLSFGHVFRCLALAEELRDRYGVNATFVMRNHPKGVGVPAGRGFPVVLLDVDTSARAEATVLAGRPERNIVADLPHPDPTVLAGLVAAGRTVTVIDDLGGRRLPATRIVNGSIVPARLRYPDVPGAPRLLVGPEYAILSAEFDDPGERPKETGAAPPTLLVTFGGSDPAGLTVPVLDLLGDVLPEGDVTIVVGPGFGPLALLEARVRAAGPRFRICRNPPSLAALMRRADLAIAAAGRTAFELARLGVPALLIPSIEHEQEVAADFARRGCALAADPRDPGAVRQTLMLLLHDAGLRHRLAQAGPMVVDGRGRARLAALLRETVGAGI